MKKFEQVSSDDHQMSLAGGKRKSGLYIEVQCIVRNGYTSPVDRHTYRSENIAFLQLRCRSVNIRLKPKSSNLISIHIFRVQSKETPEKNLWDQ